MTGSGLGVQGVERLELALHFFLRLPHGTAVGGLLHLLHADAEQLHRAGEGQAGRRQLQLLAAAETGAVPELVGRHHGLELVVPGAAPRPDEGRHVLGLAPELPDVDVLGDAGAERRRFRHLLGGVAQRRVGVEASLDAGQRRRGFVGGRRGSRGRLGVSAPALAGAGGRLRRGARGDGQHDGEERGVPAHCCSDDGPARPAGADATAMCADVSRGAGRRTSPARDGPLPSPCAGCAPCGRP